MLPQKYRLSLRTELKRVKTTGRLIYGRLFSLLVSKQLMHGKPSRFAFIISSKVHKRAVKRNQAKRLLSEAIYGLMSKIKPGFDGVFLAKEAIIGKELIEIKREVEKIFRQAGLVVTQNTSEVTG